MPGKADPQIQQAFLEGYQELKQNKGKTYPIDFMDGDHPQHKTLAGHGWIRCAVERPIKRISALVSVIFSPAVLSEPQALENKGSVKEQMKSDLKKVKPQDEMKKEALKQKNEGQVIEDAGRNEGEKYKEMERKMHKHQEGTAQKQGKQHKEMEKEMHKHQKGIKLEEGKQYTEMEQEMHKHQSGM